MKSKRNYLCEYLIIKNARGLNVDYSYVNNTKIEKPYFISAEKWNSQIFNNHISVIKFCNQKRHKNQYLKIEAKRPKEFEISNDLWNNIYTDKKINAFDKQITEFNFKFYAISWAVIIQLNGNRKLQYITISQRKIV